MTVSATGIWRLRGNILSCECNATVIKQGLFGSKVTNVAHADSEMVIFNGARFFESRQIGTTDQFVCKWKKV